MIRVGIPLKFVAVGALTLAINGALAGAGLWIAGSLGDRLAESVDKAAALRNHLTADMMHDALRADVLAAIDAVRRADPNAKAAVRADLDEHEQLFKQSIEANRHLSLPHAVETLLAAVEAPLIEYLTATRAFVEHAFATDTTEPAAFDQFMASFRKLETEMAAASDAIESDVAAANAASQGDSRVAQRAMFGALGLAVLFTLLVVLYNWTGIARPLTRISRSMSALVKSEQSIDIPFVARRDEIGDLARAAKTFQEAFEALKVARATEQRRREEEAEQARRNEALRGLAEAFDREVSDLLRSATGATDQLGQLAHQLGDTAHQAHDRTGELIDSTTRATQNVDAVSSATGELSNAVAEIGRQVSESRSLSDGAVQEVERANHVVDGLTGAAQRIGDVVGLINDIAAQTNLLALNATIEAARAGEAGKGFAVVASEVKSLANQTAKATEDVATQIAAIQASSAQVSAVIKQVKASIANISAAATAISAAVEQQGASTKEIARQVAEMTGETKTISTNSVTVAESVDKTEAASGVMLKASKELHQLSTALRAQVDGFLSEVKAA